MKRTVHLILLVLFVAALGISTVQVKAEGQSIKYIDTTDGDKEKTADNVRDFDRHMTTGWYAVTSNRSFDDDEMVTVAGDVNLILCNGATLTAEEGIHVPVGSKLTIWGQKNHEGKLVTEGDDYNAGIGGTEDGDCGDITINGGTINATGDKNAAGIGGGEDCNMTNAIITINGGNVTATGGTFACGIGSGQDNNVAGFKININGGTINATGIHYASGIGIRFPATNSADSITITGGNITAKSTTYGGYGIGGDDNDLQSIEIIGGTVTATGCSGWVGMISKKLDISGGKVTVEGGKSNGGIYAEAITIDGNPAKGDYLIVHGHSNNGICSSGSVTIKNGNIEATTEGQDCGAGIAGRTITIYKGTITASSNGTDGGAGIGGSRKEDGGTIIIHDGDITASSKGGAGIGGGYGGDSGSITINDGKITATANDYGAGIGAGAGHNCKDVTINGGTITAKGGSEGGAGIGSGITGGDLVGTVKITGGDVTAIGGAEGGAGIGGSLSGNAGDGKVIISGGKVTATGGDKAAGIGGGNEGWKSFGRGGEGATVDITGGLVIAQSGGSHSCAIGNGDNDKVKGKLTIADDMKVQAGNDLKNRENYERIFTTPERVNACQYRYNARIEKCDHPGKQFVDITEETHTQICDYCSSTFEAEEHHLDQNRCTDCGYGHDGIKVTFKADNQIYDNQDKNMYLPPDKDYLLPECKFEPESGMVFAGWKLEVDGKEVVLLDGNLFHVGEENMTITATWTKARTILLLPSIDSTDSSTYVRTDVAIGEIYTLPEESPFDKPGDDQLFLGWTRDGDTIYSPGYRFAATESATFYPVWGSTKITITLAPGEGSGEETSVQIDRGESYSLQDCPFDAPAKTRFVYWELNGEALDDVSEITPDKNVTLKAVYKQTEWLTLQDALNIGGKVDVDSSDLNGDGVITADPEDVPLIVSKPVTMDLYGITIDRACSEAQENGNVITVNSDLTIYDAKGGGSITGGWNKGAGGGLIVNGTLTLKSGTITDNRATGQGGGLYLSPDSSGLTLSGSSTISGNWNSEEKDSNVYLSSGQLITIGGDLKEASIGVTMEDAPGAFTTGYKAIMDESDPADAFTSDDTSYLVTWTEDFKEARLAENKTYTVSFDSDNGSQPVQKKVKNGHRVSKPKDPSKEDLIFLGWQLDGSDYDFDRAVTADITLKAAWHTHEWGTATYKWTKANTKVTATRICKGDSSHVETETVKTSSVVTRKATCVSSGETLYTARFKNEAFQTQTKALENLAPFGHYWGDWVVSKAATKTKDGIETRTCSVCGEKETKAIPAAGAAVLVAKGIAKGNHTIRISWKKISDADRYVIYFGKCNGGSCKAVKAVYGQTSSWTKGDLKEKTNYKFYVVAQEKTSSGYKKIAKSFSGHVITGNVRGDYTNPKSLKLKKTTISIKDGESTEISAKIKNVKPKKKLLTSHCAKLRYQSTYPGIAKVNANGKITGVNPGKCKIYVQTVNGIWKALTVTVR